MLSAKDVASFFLSTKDEEDNITHLKLQKLLYYSQGYALVLLGRPLFDENIINWSYGPVVREVYEIYRNFGKNPITHQEEQSIFSADESVLLKLVQREIGQYSAWKLKEMTHKETPWLETERNEEMKKENIKKFFEENLKENQSGSQAFNFDLNRMTDRIENQNFIPVPRSAVKDDASFDAWLRS